MSSLRRRRLVVSLVLSLVAVGGSVWGIIRDQQSQPPREQVPRQQVTTSPALEVLSTIPVKGRAPKTGYSRQQFGNGWREVGSCDMRNIILARDMQDETLQSAADCRVVTGTLHDPYTAKTISFVRGPGSSAKVQIDHVVALSDAWQKGAQQLTPEERDDLANDPLNLLAVDGPANNNKSDGDAATWLPPNKAYRCSYIARQLAVKQAYRLWVTQAEKEAMKRVLGTCPDQKLPLVTDPAS